MHGYVFCTNYKKKLVFLSSSWKLLRRKVAIHLISVQYHYNHYKEPEFDENGKLK